MNARRIAFVAVGIAAVAILFLLLRPADEETDAVPTTTITATTAPSPPTTSTVEPTPKPKLPRIVFRGGKLVGGVQTIEGRQGKLVVFEVLSDVADEVHVHGVDVTRDLVPGKPARVDVTPPAAGRYEVELEQRGLQIAELRIEP